MQRSREARRMPTPIGAPHVHARHRVRPLREALAWVSVVLAFSACGKPDPIIETATVQLRYPTDPACRDIGLAPRFAAEALGDFPPNETLVEGFLHGTTRVRFDRFPFDTRWVAVRAFDAGELGGAALRMREGSFAADLMLLPYARTCLVGHPEARVPRGSAVAVTADDEIVVVGGNNVGGTFSRRVVRLPAGTETVELVVGRAGLINSRSSATATVVGDRVLVAGGNGQDTYELYDTTLRAFTRGAALCGGPRDSHGAARLPDGTVLLVGGVQEAAEGPRADGEIIDPDTGCRGVITGLEPARTDALVTVLDDASVLVVGGRDRLGAYVQQPMAFDGTQFVPLPVAFPTMSNAALVALPGARIAAIGGVDGAGHASRLVSILLPDHTRVDLLDFLPFPVASPNAAALPDGTIFVSGPPDVAPFALRIDVGLGITTVLEPWSRGSERIVALSDGTIVELDLNGIARRRLLLRTSFDNPPTTLLPMQTSTSRAELAFDAVSNWDMRRASVASVRDVARVDVPGLRFGDFTVRLVSDDGVKLVLVGGDEPTFELPVLAGRAGMVGCDIAHTPGSPLTVSRHADELLLDSGIATRACRIPDLPEHVGLALTAARGAQISSFSVTRGR